MNRHVLKVFCLAVSVLIWIQVASGRLLTHDVELPLRLTGLPPGTTLVGNTWPKKLQVRATGTKWQFFLNRFFGRDLGEAVVDLSKAGPGVQFEHDVTSADLITNLSKAEIEPPYQLELFIDSVDSLRVPVAVSVTGNLPQERMVVDPLRAVPDSVELVGPHRFLAENLKARTETVDVGRERGRVDLLRGVTPPRPELTPRPRQVHVVGVVAEVGSRLFEQVPLVPLLDSGRHHVEVFPPVASVEIRGPADSLAVMDASAISLTLSLSGLGPGKHKVRPEAHLPEHCSLVSLDPESFDVVVGKAGGSAGR